MACLIPRKPEKNSLSWHTMYTMFIRQVVFEMPVTCLYRSWDDKSWYVASTSHDVWVERGVAFKWYWSWSVNFSLNESECKDLFFIFEPYLGSISKLHKNRSLLRILIQQARYLLLFDVSQQNWKLSSEGIPAHAHQILLWTQGLN